MFYLTFPRRSRLFDLDTVFNELLDWSTPPARTIPSNTDVKETDKELTLRTTLPGFSKDEVNISVDEGILKITAKHADKKDKDNWLKEEYSNSYYLPDKINVEKISANLENGILTITLPYNEKSKPQSISIK